MRKTIWIIVAVILIVALTSSGWVYNIVVKSNQLIKDEEASILQVSFLQQYGNQATIQQIIPVNKIYMAQWIDADEVAHISLIANGFWITVR